MKAWWWWGTLHKLSRTIIIIEIWDERKIKTIKNQENTKCKMLDVSNGGIKYVFHNIYIYSLSL